MMPISYFTISSPYLGPAELRRLAEEKIEPMFERVDGVASVQTMGGSQRRINVNMNPVLLASYHLSPNDVMQAIQLGSSLQPSGTIRTRGKDYNLRVLSEYASLDQIKKTSSRTRTASRCTSAMSPRLKTDTRKTQTR